MFATSKHRDNKGFSLVKFIIIVAMVAALAAIIAPQIVRYIERSRADRDAATLDEVSRAVTIALRNEATYTEVIKGSLSADLTITLNYTTDGTLVSNDAPAAALLAEMQKVLGGDGSVAGEISELPALVSGGRLSQTTVAFTVKLAKDGTCSVSHPAPTA